MADTKFAYPRSPAPSEHDVTMVVTVVVGLVLAAAIVLFAHWLGKNPAAESVRLESPQPERSGRSFP